MSASHPRITAFYSHATLRILILSVIVGVVAGLGAALFQTLCQFVTWGTLETWAGYSAPEPTGEPRLFPPGRHTFVPWMLVLITTIGGLISGLLVFCIAPEAEGHGTDNVIAAFHHGRGLIRARVPLVKLLASAITIGTGGSGGREGPIAQIGAAFGSNMARLLRLSVRERRILMAAGMGAGIGSIFRAPLAGAMFSAEIMYRDADIESDVIVPSAIASIIGYATFSQFLPVEFQNQPLFGSQTVYVMSSLWELIPLGLMALLLSGASWFYVRTFYGTVRLTHQLPLPPHFKPAIGAGLAALIGIGLYFLFDRNILALGVLATGYGTLEVALSNASTAGIGLLCAVAFAKIITTSLTISSGGSGGVFGPSMVIGGCLGAACGLIFHHFFPGIVKQPELFAIVGMAGFFAGSARAPISTVLMVSEITGDYGLLLPTLWVSSLCFVLCRGWTLYHCQVDSRSESPVHQYDWVPSQLAEKFVKDIKLTHTQVLRVDEPLTRIMHLLTTSHQNVFPVVDHYGALVGRISLDQLLPRLEDQTGWPKTFARDLSQPFAMTLTLSTPLAQAISDLAKSADGVIPVIDPDAANHYLGMLTSQQIMGSIHADHRE